MKDAFAGRNRELRAECEAAVDEAIHLAKERADQALDGLL